MKTSSKDFQFLKKFCTSVVECAIKPKLHAQKWKWKICLSAKYTVSFSVLFLLYTHIHTCITAFRRTIAYFRFIDRFLHELLTKISSRINHARKTQDEKKKLYDDVIKKLKKLNLDFDIVTFLISGYLEILYTKKIIKSYLVVHSVTKVKCKWSRRRFERVHHRRSSKMPFWLCTCLSVASN